MLKKQIGLMFLFLNSIRIDSFANYIICHKYVYSYIHIIYVTTILYIVSIKHNRHIVYLKQNHKYFIRGVCDTFMWECTLHIKVEKVQIFISESWQHLAICLTRKFG